MNGDLAARVEQACQDLLDAGRPVSVTEVAAQSGVDRSTLDRHAELRTLIQEHSDRCRDTFTQNGHAAVAPANGQFAPASLEQPAGSPTGSAAAPPPAHHRRRAHAILQRLISEHGKRFARFGIIGVGVFIGGLALDILLVKYAHLKATPAYVIQGTLAIQASFVLNYYWTWRDRRVPFWRACYRFNVQKATTAALNILLYAGLIRLGTNYLAANVFTVAVFTLINYVLGHYWAFRARRAGGLAQSRTDGSQAAGLAPPSPPGVSTGPTVPARFPWLSALLHLPTNIYRWLHAAVWSRNLSRSRLPRPLILVLILQAGLSLGLIWSNTALGDEALYLWAGHLEWAHWLHGMPTPAFNFSAAPALYPPLGAMASSIGGLAGARMLSLLCMLGATVLLYWTAGRLFGQRQALLAAIAWAICEPALKLGALATYDALATLLIVASVWCLTYAADGRWWPVFAAVLLMVLGDLTAFAVAIQNVVVVLAAFLILVPRLGLKRAILRMELLIGGTLGLFFAIILRFNLAHDLIGSTVERPGGLNEGHYLIIRDAWLFTGLIMVLAVLGAIAGVLNESDRFRAALLIVLAAAAFLVPAYQARLDTAISLDKHLAAGAWFAAMAAGYALDTLSRSFSLSRYRMVIPVCAIALTYASITGFYEAAVQFHYWPNMSRVTAVLRPLLPRVRGNILVEQYPAIQQYYLPQGHQWWRWRAGLAVSASEYNKPGWFAGQLQEGDFGLIALNFNDAYDCRFVQAIDDDPSYQVIDVVPYNASFHLATDVYVIWARKTENLPVQDHTSRLLLLDTKAKAGCPIDPGGYPPNDISFSVPYGANSTLITEHTNAQSQNQIGGR